MKNLGWMISRKEKIMQGMKSLSKQDLIDMINENFADSKEQDIIATFCYSSNGHREPQQQCILFRKEIYNP